jgi:hypothetical protein
MSFTLFFALLFLVLQNFAAEQPFQYPLAHLPLELAHDMQISSQGQILWNPANSSAKLFDLISTDDFIWLVHSYPRLKEAFVPGIIIQYLLPQWRGGLAMENPPATPALPVLPHLLTPIQAYFKQVLIANHLSSRFDPRYLDRSRLMRHYAESLGLDLEKLFGAIPMNFDLRQYCLEQASMPILFTIADHWGFHKDTLAKHNPDYPLCCLYLHNPVFIRPMHLLPHTVAFCMGIKPLLESISLEDLKYYLRSAIWPIENNRTDMNKL